MRFAIMLLPWMELFTLIELGVKTSALTAVLYVFTTLILGLAIVQRQGRGMFERFRLAQDGRIFVPELLMDDMAVGFAGLLFMIPGIITDLLALVVMIGPLRRRLVRALWRPSAEVHAPKRDTDSHETIEGVFRQVDDENGT